MAITKLGVTGPMTAQAFTPKAEGSAAAIANQRMTMGMGT